MSAVHEILGASQTEPGDAAQAVRDAEDVAARSPQSRPDGGAAEIDDAEAFFTLVHTPAVTAERFGVGAHFAAERGEHRVLVLCPSDLNDVGKLLFLLLKGFIQGYYFQFELSQQCNPGDF